MSSALAAEPFTPSAGRRPEKTEAILEAAGQLFREQGYGAVSMDQIAREAGVSKATVYAHFESKDELFGAVVADVSARRFHDFSVEALDPVDIENSLRLLV